MSDFFPISTADEVLLKFYDACLQEPFGESFLMPADTLKNSKDEIKLATRVVVASLAELQLLTHVGQASGIERVISMSRHVEDFVERRDLVCEGMDSNELRRHRTQLIMRQLSLSESFVSSLHQMLDSILVLDTNDPSFRNKINGLVRTYTASPLEQFPSCFRTPERSPAV